MGKFNNSNIHNKYSDWHWRMIDKDEKYRRLYVCDIDRIWIEYDFKKESVVAVIDIKYENTNDGLTPTEKGIYDWFMNNGVGCFIVYINREFTKFRVVSLRDRKEKIFGEIEYADWLLSLRGNPYYFPGTPIQPRLSTAF